MTNFEDVIRDAGRQHRRVRVRFQDSPGNVYDREYEPYAIENGALVAFSYMRDEFRTLPLRDILEVEVTSRTFVPRRKVDL